MEQDLIARINSALAQEQLDENAEMQLIKDYVAAYRSKHGISEQQLGFKELPELSCEYYGEGNNLLYRQLMPTREGYGYWQDLKDAEIRKLVVEQIRKDAPQDFPQASAPTPE